MLSILLSTRHKSSGSFIKNTKPPVERYRTARTKVSLKLLFNKYIKIRHHSFIFFNILNIQKTFVVCIMRNILCIKP
jgi:hypothetical protein